MASWFYYVDGKKYGPVSSNDLRNLAANKSLHHRLSWKRILASVRMRKIFRD